MSDRDHNHHHHSHGGNKRVLHVSLLLIGSFMLVEAAAGWFSNSLALLSDAGHMFSDAAALDDFREQTLPEMDKDRAAAAIVARMAELMLKRTAA